MKKTILLICGLLIFALATTAGAAPAPFVADVSNGGSSYNSVFLSGAPGVTLINNQVTMTQVSHGAIFRGRYVPVATVNNYSGQTTMAQNSSRRSEAGAGNENYWDYEATLTRSGLRMSLSAGSNGGTYSQSGTATEEAHQYTGAQMPGAQVTSFTGGYSFSTGNGSAGHSSGTHVMVRITGIRM